MCWHGAPPSRTPPALADMSHDVVFDRCHRCGADAEYLGAAAAAALALIVVGDAGNVRASLKEIREKKKFLKIVLHWAGGAPRSLE
jgi:hypothetical protein